MVKRIACLVIFTSCLPWDDAFNARVAMLDGGAVTTVPPDAGVDAGLTRPPDAGTRPGTDAGQPDAGCAGALCLISVLEAGESIRSLSPMANGGFLGVGRHFIFAQNQSQSQVVTISPTAVSSKQVPYTFFDGITSYAVVGTPDEYWVSANSGFFHIVNDVYAGTADDLGCGFHSNGWYGVSPLEGGGVLASGGFGKVCVYTPDAGNQPQDVVADAGLGSEDLEAQTSLPGGDWFVVGQYGDVIHQPGDGGQYDLTHPTDEDFAAIHGIALDTVWAITVNGKTFKRVNGAWQSGPTVSLTSGQGQALSTTLWVAAPDDIWVASLGGVLVHFEHGTWAPVTLPNVSLDATYDLKSVASHGTRDLVIGGTHNLADGGETGFAWLYRRN